MRDADTRAHHQQIAASRTTIATGPLPSVHVAHCHPIGEDNSCTHVVLATTRELLVRAIFATCLVYNDETDEETEYGSEAAMEEDWDIEMTVQTVFDGTNAV
tara:strand:+ start:670 stop:975 length:306 start_codon:yes stop_codon:yes gene_type:complete